MNRVVRLALISFGLVVALHGVANLVGGWIGAPPRWWWQSASHSGREERLIAPFVSGAIAVVGGVIFAVGITSGRVPRLARHRRHRRDPLGRTPMSRT